MRQIQDQQIYADERELEFFRSGCCVYCGANNAATKDHVPAKAFLSSALPTGFPTVPACEACNNGFSDDEKYVASLIQCTLVGTTEVLQKDKDSSLRARLSSAQYQDETGSGFIPEEDRVAKVVRKLALGHAFFELHHRLFDSPCSIDFRPLIRLTEAEQEAFNSGTTLWPEVGTRAMQRLCYEPENAGWVEVQPGRYRYIAYVESDAVVVKMLIGGYLACEVRWNVDV